MRGHFYGAKGAGKDRLKHLLPTRVCLQSGHCTGHSMMANAISLIGIRCHWQQQPIEIEEATTHKCDGSDLWLDVDQSRLQISRIQAALTESSISEMCFFVLGPVCCTLVCFIGLDCWPAASVMQATDFRFSGKHSHRHMWYGSPYWIA
ncbi:hypothetical protein MPH_04503 [Macrophomina phaseolina MS6]|uniref:Uncharacterized protein n=1 Tax=Macrophomina phaseolina (strain MS6) TaxID=1126212 RepID=K2RTX9_MACPH|nr:hypothetical protein MPH_04503 [Macrophomina phaseolina MS6]